MNDVISLPRWIWIMSIPRLLNHSFWLRGYIISHYSDNQILRTPIKNSMVVVTHTVDGRNPAPVGRWFFPLWSHQLQCFIGTPHISQMVQDFFHPQYGSMMGAVQCPWHDPESKYLVLFFFAQGWKPAGTEPLFSFSQDGTYFCAAISLDTNLKFQPL